MKKKITWQDYIWIMTSKINNTEKGFMLGISMASVGYMVNKKTHTDDYENFKVMSRAKIDAELSGWTPIKVDSDKMGEKKISPVKTRLDLRDVIYILDRPNESRQSLADTFNIAPCSISGVRDAKLARELPALAKSLSDTEKAQIMATHKIIKIKRASKKASSMKKNQPVDHSNNRACKPMSEWCVS